MGMKLGAPNLMEHARLVRSWLWRWEDNTTIAPGALTSDPILGEDIRGALFWDQGGTGEADALMAPIKDATDAMAYVELLTSAAGGSQPYSRVFNVKDPAYGAKGDGTTDDLAAFNAAKAAALAVGGGVIYFPAGVYMHSLVFSVAVGEDNLHIVGDGPGLTIIRTLHLQSGVAGGVTILGNNWSIANLSVDGRLDDYEGALAFHGISCAGTNWLISNVEVYNTVGYGIALSQGTTRSVNGKIRDVYIHDAGADGIESKNPVPGNQGNSIVGAWIENWGVRPGEDAADSAGIDLRGSWTVSNFYISLPVDTDQAKVGIRVRGGGEPGGEDEGGRRAKISNGIVEGPLDASVVAGVQTGHHDVSVSNVYVRGFLKGFEHFGVSKYSRVTYTGCQAVDAIEAGFKAVSDEANFVNCHAWNCDPGFHMPGHDATLTHTSVRDCPSGYSVSGDRARITIGRVYGDSGTGLTVTGTADGTTVRGVDFSQFGGTTVVNNGTNTVIRDCSGYVTRNAGVTSVADGGTIAHGLVTTPTAYGATATTADEYVAITAVSSTTLTVALTKHDGSAGTTANVAWWAES